LFATSRLMISTTRTTNTVLVSAIPCEYCPVTLDRAWSYSQLGVATKLPESASCRLPTSGSSKR
jgi:hypothetical protein